MKLIDPSAATPIVQLSVLASEDPAHSYAVGRALSSLRSQNIAIIGSGFATFHNIRMMFSGASSTPEFKKQNTEWSNTLTDAAMTDNDKEREGKFEHWRNWPAAYTMHPRGGAEHFLPLIVCAGAAGLTGATNMLMSSWVWICSVITGMRSEHPIPLLLLSDLDP
jgi:aromatic ring-opening dioxygenase catalytic subunit (LigB family)